jgi:pantoate--beta-alanine ligase
MASRAAKSGRKPAARPRAKTVRKSAIEIVRTVADLRGRVAAWRGAGLTVGLVPTMGALHDGHLTLVRTALSGCDRVVVTLFVNPTQFGPKEDLAAYPREEARDAALVAGAGANLLFAPPVETMYAEGAATTVSVARLSEGLCGDHRPGHFAGVATIVAKLLVLAAPDRAYFGEKDYQQLQVIRRLAADLFLPVEIVGVPTVRESDGLALSSRNAYLSPAERAAAPALNRALSAVAKRLADGTARVADEIAWAKEELLRAGFARVDYVDVRHAKTLAPSDGKSGPARVFAAAWMGRTRLIDNVAVPRTMPAKTVRAGRS